MLGELSRDYLPNVVKKETLSANVEKSRYREFTYPKALNLI